MKIVLTEDGKVYYGRYVQTLTDGQVWIFPIFRYENEAWRPSTLKQAVGVEADQSDYPAVTDLTSFNGQ